MVLKTILAAALAAALPAQTALAAQTCLTPAEAKGIGMFVLPDVVVALRDKCRATLSSDAYLNRAEAAERFRPEAELRWPVARRGFARLAGGDGVVSLIGDEATRKLLVGSVTQGIAKDVKPNSCAGIDRLLEALAPLPPTNVDMLVDSFLLLGLGNGTGKSAFRLCSPDSAIGTAP